MTYNTGVTTLRELIDEAARWNPEEPFLISPEARQTLTFSDLQQRSVILSEVLFQAGMKFQDKVAFLMDNGLLTAQLFLAAMYGGFVAVPLNVRAGGLQLSYMLDHCDAKVVFVEEQYQPLLEEAMADVRRPIRVIAASVDGTIAASEAHRPPCRATLPAPMTWRS